MRRITEPTRCNVPRTSAIVTVGRSRSSLFTNYMPIHRRRLPLTASGAILRESYVVT